MRTYTTQEIEDARAYLEATRQPGEPLKSGICFDLYARNGAERCDEVVFFANFPIRLWDGQQWNDPPCFKESMPETWHPRYRWQDLNIMKEAYIRRPQGWGQRDEGDRIDLKALFHFIGAFLEEHPHGIYMHVFESRLPSQPAGAE